MGVARRTQKGESSAFLPLIEVRFLLIGQFINADAHGHQLQACDLHVDISWYSIDLRGKFFHITNHILGAEGLIGKAHIHY